MSVAIAVGDGGRTPARVDQRDDGRALFRAQEALPDEQAELGARHLLDAFGALRICSVSMTPL
jgi:hypothetical protein